MRSPRLSAVAIASLLIVSILAQLGPPQLTTSTTRSTVSPIRLAGSLNSSLIARFTYFPSSPVVGQGVGFDGSSSTDTNGTITNYTWNYGDLEVQSNFVPTMFHVYLIPGNVTVTLTITDSFGRNASTSKTIQISVDPTSFLSALRLKTGEVRPGCSIIDTARGYAYFGLYQIPGEIVKIRLSDFTEVATLTLTNGEDYLTSMAFDNTNNIVYVGTSTFPGKIIKIDLSTLTETGTISLNTGENEVYTALLDTNQGFAYFGLGGFPSEIIRVRTSNFARNGTITLPFTQTQPESAVIDTAAGYAYFGTYTIPGNIIKIRLSNFTDVGSLTLGPGVGFLSTASIDPANQLAYFAAQPNGGTQTSFSQIIKISLSNFTQIGSFNLLPGEFDIVAAPIDPILGYSYLTILGYNGGDVARLQLASLTRQKTVNLLPGEVSPQTAALDTSNGFLYIGLLDVLSSTPAPGLIVRLKTAAFDVKPTASFTFSPANPVTGQTVTFDGTNSGEPGSFVSFNWSFGDGAITNSEPFAFHSYQNSGNYTVTLTITDNGGASASVSHTVTVVSRPPDIPPIAQFTFNPHTAPAGTTINFDGSASRDPDGYITSFSWNFGDNTFGSSFSVTSHNYQTAGNYTITLTVTDNAGLTATASAIITITPRPQHDVAVTSVFPEFTQAIQTQTVTVNVELANYGIQDETVSVSVFFNSTVVATQTHILVPINSLGTYNFIQFDTTNIPPGTYTVSATVYLASDQNLSNNSLTDGQVTILPRPTITATPESGAIGTKVTVQGRGFSTNTYGYPDEVVVTFDDMLTGFVFTTTGNFNFTFDVPTSQPGPHMIKASDSTNVRASIGFTVLSAPRNLAVTLAVGTLYFPGDTIDTYVLITQNGAPVGAGATIVLTETFPNGTSQTVPTSSTTTGVFKATLKAPNLLGTYQLIANASLNNSNSSAQATFLVKPTWLSQHGNSVMTIATVIGALGFVGIAWRQGYFRRKSSPDSAFTLE